MAKKTYTCRDVTLPHAAMMALRNAGHLNLGIDDQVASNLSTAGVKSTKTTAWGAYTFWNFIGIVALGVGIWWAFTSAWWWGLVGLAAMIAIMRANQKGNASNLVDAGMVDAAFYERVRAAGGWLYQIEESEAEKLRTAGASI